MTERALWIAKSGLEAQQTKMAVIANNLANVNTTGFKEGRANFEDLMYQSLRQVGAQSSQNTQLPTGLQLGTGVRVVGTQRIHTQGPIIAGSEFDIAINGRGFFQILMPNGEINYTRDGTFHPDANGELRTTEGYALDPSIILPTGYQLHSFSVGVDGTVTAIDAAKNAIQIGQITLADFINPAGLESLGGNRYRETVASGPPVIGAPDNDGFGQTIEHSLEGSNVNVVTELVNMIETQRAYEMNSKAISTTDQMLSFITQQL